MQDIGTVVVNHMAFPATGLGNMNLTHGALLMLHRNDITIVKGKVVISRYAESQPTARATILSKPLHFMM